MNFSCSVSSRFFPIALTFLIVLLAGCASSVETKQNPLDPIATSHDPAIEIHAGEVLIFGRFINKAKTLPTNPFVGVFMPSLELVHAPNDAQSLADKVRKQEGPIPYSGDFRVTSLKTRPDGFFYALVPPGQFMMRKFPEKIPWLAFDAPEEGNVYYLGTVTLDDEGVNSINWIRYLSVANDYSEARGELAKLLPQLDEQKIHTSLMYRFPCSFNTIAYPPNYAGGFGKKPAIAAGKLAVAVAASAPDPLDTLTKERRDALVKEMAATGARHAVEDTIRGSFFEDWRMIFALPATIPIAAAGGAVIGAIQGSREADRTILTNQQAADAERILRKASEGTPLAENLAIRVVDAAKAIGIAADLRSEISPQKGTELSSYDGLIAEGYGSVLELTVLNAGFRVKDKAIPRLSFGFVLKVQTVTRDRPGNTAYRHLAFESQTRSLSDWLVNDGQLLSEQWSIGMGQLADCVCEALVNDLPKAKAD
jgi:hypothetical protein